MTLPNYIQEPVEEAEEEKKKPSYDPFGPNAPGVEPPEQEIIRPTFNIPENMKMYHQSEIKSGLPEQEGYKVLPDDWGYAMSRQFGAPGSSYFAQDPRRLAKYHYFLQSAPEGWESPAWLDRDKFEQAFSFMSQTYGDDWTQWETLEPEDPTNLYLATLNDPPLDFRFPNEINQQDELLNYLNKLYVTDDGWITEQTMREQQAQALAQQQAQISPFMQEGTWQDLEKWQQLAMSIFSPQPMEGRPESSRIFAAGFQGAQAGVAGLAIGATAGTIAGVPGMAVGAILGGLIGTAAGYQAYTGNEIPGINKLLTLMDAGAITAEKLVGLVAQAKDGEVQEVLQNLPEAWKAAEFVYEASGVGTKALNIMSGAAQGIENVLNGLGANVELSSGMKADYAAGQIWALERAIVEPYMLEEGYLGGESLDKIRSRLISGENFEDIYGEYISQYGFSGTVGDFVAQSVLDPLNFVPGMQGEIIGKVASKVDNPGIRARLSQAVYMNKGSILKDALPMGTKWVADIIQRKRKADGTWTKVKGSGGAFDIMRAYKNLIRQGGVAEGFLPTTTIPESVAISLTNPELFSDSGRAYRDIWNNNLTELAEGKGAAINLEGVKTDFRSYIETELQKVGVDIGKAEVQRVIDSAVDGSDNVITDVAVNNYGKNEAEFQANLQEAFTEYFDDSIGRMKWGEKTKEIKYYPEISEWERKFAGLTEEGTFAELDPTRQPKNWFQKLAALDVESQAITHEQMLFTNVAGILTMAEGDVAYQNSLLKQMAGVDPIMVGDVAASMIQSPATKTTAPILKAFVDTGLLDEMYSVYIATKDTRTRFSLMANTLDLEVGKLLQMIEDEPGAVIQMISNNDSGKLADFKQAIDAGLLNAESLKAEFEPFWGTKQLPLNGQMYTAQLLMQLSDFADKFLVDYYGIKAKPVINRLSSALKSMQSLAVLGFNPLYAVYNYVNNVASRAAQGVFGFQSPKQIQRFWTKFGVKPAMLDVGVGLAGMPDGTHMGGQAITAAMDVDDFVGKLRKASSKASKLGVFANAAAKIEVMESRQATTIGTQQAWDSLWKPGVAMSKLPPQVEAQLNQRHPGMTRFMYNMAQSGIDMDGIVKSLYARSKYQGIKSVMERAVQNVFTDYPDVARDLIQKTGLDSMLNDLIGDNPTVDDIDTAFEFVKAQSEAIVEQAYSQDLITRAEDVKNRILSEGWSAMMPLWGEMWSNFTARRLQDIIDNTKIANVADAFRGQKDYLSARRTWDAHLNAVERRWNRTHAMMLQTAKGMIDAVGTTDPAAGQYVNIFSDWMDGWDKFYADRNLEFRKFFNKDLKGEARNKAWVEVQKKIANMYDTHTQTEKAQMQAMFEHLGRVYENTSHRPGSEVRAWGENVVKAWDDTANTVRDFREGLRNTELSITEVRQAFETFNTETFKPLVLAQRNAMIEGAQALSKYAKPAAAYDIPNMPQFPLLTEGGGDLGGQGTYINEAGGTVRPGIMDRFTDAFSLRQEINNQAERMAGFTATDKQRNMVAAMLSEVYPNVEERHAVQRFLFDTNSMTMAKPEKVRAALNLFIAVDEQGNTVFTIPENVRGALEQALQAAREEAGQITLDIKPADVASDAEKAQYNEQRITTEADRTAKEQAVHAEALMTRNAFKEKIRTAFNLSREQQLAVMALVDAHAEVWGKRNGKSADAWFAERISDVESINRLEGVDNVEEFIAKYGEIGDYSTFGEMTLAENGKILLRGFERADVATAVHELAHVFRQELSTEELQTFIEWTEYGGSIDDFKGDEIFWRSGRDPGKAYFLAEEKFAEGFEIYLYEGLAEDVAPPALISIFRKFADWLRTIYNSITGENKPDVNISPEMKRIYDRLFFDEEMVQTRNDLSKKLKHYPTGDTSVAIGVNTTNKYSVQFKIVELADIVTSHDVTFKKVDLYPQELQGRFRDRAALQAQVMGIAKGLDPAQLIWDMKLSDMGAPIVGPDMVVESGNGRSIALAYAAKHFPDNYKSYVDTLKTQLINLGFNETALDGMEYPVLVRQRLDDVDRIKFSLDANADRKAQMSSYEQALIDKSLVDPKLFVNLSSGVTQDIRDVIQSPTNKDVIQKAFVNKLSKEELNKVFDGKEFSKQGIDRIRLALMAKVFDTETGARLVQLFGESADPLIRNIEIAIDNALGDLLIVESLVEDGRRPEELQIAQDISAVANAYMSVKESGLSFTDWRNSPELLTVMGDKHIDIGLYDADTPADIAEVRKELLYFFGENSRKVKPQTELMKRYSQKVISQAETTQMDMFAGARLTKIEMLREIFQDLVDEGTSSSFLDYRAGGREMRTLFQRRVTTKPEGLSKFQSDRIERAFQRSAFDNDRIDAFEGIQFNPSEGYRYSYYSPSRPIDGMSFKLDKDFQISDNGWFVYTKEPLTINEIVKNELAPHTGTARGELLKTYYMKKYGTSDFFVLGNKETLRGTLITRSTAYENGWRATYFDEKGFSGHTEYNSLDKALLHGGDRYQAPQSPDWFDRLSNTWPKEPRTLFQKRVVTEVPQAGTPVPQYDGMLKDEIFSETLTPLLDEMHKIAQDDMERGTAFSLEDLPENLNNEVQAWLNHMPQEMAATKLTAMRHGEEMRNRALLNYQERRGIDDYMNMVFPYQFWFTRTMGEWAKRMIEKPAWIASYARLRRHQKRMEQEGIPSRLKGKMRIPAAWLPDWMGDALYIDPFKQLFPFAQFTTPFEMTAQLGQNVEYAAIREVQNMVGQSITAKQAEKIIAEKDSPQWNEALARAQAQLQEAGDLNAMNITSMMMSPAMWWTYPYHILKGTPEQLYPLPGTRTGQALREFGGPLGVIGNIMALPEETIRKKFNLSSYGEWGDYYVDRALANMAAEGVITADDAQIAMIERQGAAYDQAFDRVQKEMALKIPGSQTGLALQEGRLGGILYTLPTTLFPAGLLPEGELKQRNLKTVYNKAWQDYENGDPQAINKFFEQHPEYQARLALFDEPQERLQQFLISEIWDKWTELEDKNKPLVVEQLGDNFERMFLNSDTRDYESIDNETLTYWAQQLGGKTPGSEKSPLYLQEGLKLYKPEVIAAVEEFQTTRQQKFPNYKFLQDTYWSLPEDQREGFVEAMPELEEYWDWKDQYYEDNPNVKTYQEEQKKRYEDASSIYTTTTAQVQPTTEQATAEIVSQTMMPALMMQIVLHHYAGQPIEGPARVMLMEYWESMGQPGGSFEQWVELVKGYIMK